MSSHPPLVWQRIEVHDLDTWLALLHAAYARNLEDGMNFAAATIGNEHGEIIIRHDLVCGGFAGAELVATFTLRQDEEGWHLNFLAVDPRFGRSGYGDRALAEAELQARRLGATTLLLDTAEVHPWLCGYYERRGYFPYDRRQWPGKTYRSVLFRKPLP